MDKKNLALDKIIRNSIQVWFQLSKLKVRYHSRFFLQLLVPNGSLIGVKKKHFFIKKIFLADQPTFGRWRLKNPDFWLSKSIFYVKNYPNLSNFFFIEEYQFRGIFVVIDIFWKLQFLNHFVTKIMPIFQSPPATRTLICQKFFFMEKCYFSLN